MVLSHAVVWNIFELLNQKNTAAFTASTGLNNIRVFSFFHVDFKLLHIFRQDVGYRDEVEVLRVVYCSPAKNLSPSSLVANNIKAGQSVEDCI
jgi:hypothetical protein